jgi:hypothetical protein
LYLHSLLRLAWTVSYVVVAGAGDDIGGGGAGTVDGDSVHGDKMKDEGVFLVFYELMTAFVSMLPVEVARRGWRQRGDPSHH